MENKRASLVLKKKCLTNLINYSRPNTLTGNHNNNTLIRTHTFPVVHLSADGKKHRLTIIKIN